jgi:hypothetical protein
MKFLIEWKDTKDQAIYEFGILKEGENGEDMPNDDSIFYWLTPEEAFDIGRDYDGGDWVVIRCACDECENIKCKNCGYEIDEASDQGFCDNCERAYQLGKEGK